MAKALKKKEPDRRNLTPLFCVNVKPLEKRRIIWDTKQQGLGFVVHPTGKKSWKMPYRHGKRLRWFTLGTYPKVTLKAARIAAEEVMAQVAAGRDPMQEKADTRLGHTFKELSLMWLKSAKEERRSWQQAERYLNKELLPRWGGRLARDIARADVRAMADKITNRGSPVAANGALAVASRIFSWGIEEGKIDVVANPCTGVKRRPTSERDRVFTEDEIKRLWAAFDGTPTGAALRFQLLTAQRVGEVRQMRFDQIDGNWWTIPATVTKNKKSHRVWLSDAAMGIVEAQRGKDYVFGGDAELGKVYAGPIREASGVADFRTHDLRRTAATKIAGMGVQSLTLSRLLNHAEGGVTQIYNRHRFDEEKRMALDAWAAELDRIVTGREPDDNVVRPEFRAAS